MTTDEYGLIQEELARILASPHFCNSTRCSDFLRFVVRLKCEGREDHIKERTIGQEVFGREVGFETSGDSIVRVRAVEVRNRLGRYYAEAAPGRVRIELPTGTYAPVFRWNLETEAARQPEAESREPLPLPPVPPAGTLPPKPQGGRSWFWESLLVIAFFTVGGLWLSGGIRGRSSALDAFWRPALETKGKVMIGMPEAFFIQTRRHAREALREGQNQGRSYELKPGEYRIIENFHSSQSTVNALFVLERYFVQRKANLELFQGPKLNALVAAENPIVLLGAAKQPWAKQKLERLPYRFAGKGIPEGFTMWIEKSADAKPIYQIPNIYPWAEQRKDYAIITRLREADGKSFFVSLAGLNMFGVEAAALVLSNESLFAKAAAKLEKGWEQKNIQILLETGIVNMSPADIEVKEVVSWD